VICDLAGRAVAEGHEAIAMRMPSAQSIDVVASRVQDALSAAGITREAVLGVGVAIAAPIERPAGTLHADDLLPGWGDEPPQPAIEARLGLPVVVENDANAGAIGERTFGAAAGVDDLIYVRLSTGVGAGLIVGGSIYTGGSGMAGEIGHVTVVEDGPICRCGNRGCLEAVAGPPVVAGLLSAAVGEPVSVPRMLELVAEGHRGALRAIDDAGALAGRAIAATVNVLNPRMVVVGGELAGAGAPLLDAVRRAVRRHASPPIASTVEVRPGTLGEQAEVLGAAALILADAPQRLSERIGRRGAPSAAA
jgi:predicted NBD/HSP70 family sugar kinase